MNMFFSGSRTCTDADRPNRSQWRGILGAIVPVAMMATALVAPGCGSKSGNLGPAAPVGAGIPGGRAVPSQVQHGRYLVLTSGCIDCHNRGKNDPSDPHWMAGYLPGTAGQPFEIGPWKTYPANLTPDAATGIGMHSDRQIYNALKYGLDPEDTPDVTITSTTPGQGNFPANPHYLAPPMPWTSTRHLNDEDIWAIVAYLKHGIKPVTNVVPDTQGPPTTWANTALESAAGPWNLPAYPAGNELFNP